MTLKLGDENRGDTQPSEPGVYAVQSNHWLWFKRQTGFAYCDDRGAWSNVQSDYHACVRQFRGVEKLLRHQIERRGMHWWHTAEVVDDGEPFDLVEALRKARGQ